MTNLNRLFSKYFIVTITIVVMFITVVSNIGGSLFFKNFVQRKNDAQNSRIVETITDLVDTVSISVSEYPYVLSFISRQEQVNVFLYKDSKLIAYSVSKMLPMKRTVNNAYVKQFEENQMIMIEKLAENEGISYIEYEIGPHLLVIGRAADLLLDNANAEFLSALNKFFIMIFVFAMVVAFISALILSRRFNKPIMQLRDNVSNISMNRYNHIKECDTKAKELMELSDDINNLAVQIQREEEMRRRLSNDIVHELKTPIAVLSTNIEAILDGVYKADEERMTVLLSQTNRLARLVNNLSDLTLLETENKNTPMERVDISNILDSIYTVYLPAASDKSIELIKEFNDGLFVNGNEDRLLQVFVNIVSNSLKYTDEGGEIAIRGYYKSGSVVCEVEDTGIGIDEKDLPFIFNRFYRGDESRSRATGGSGIGLAIAKAIVSAHDGEIEITSQKGLGTKISVILKKID